MKLWGKIRVLFRKNKLDSDMAEERRLHLELQTERNVAAGMNPNEARYAARRAFGGVEQIKETARDQRGWVWPELLGKNLRFAARSLLRSPGFTATALITLALCLGANLTIFAVIDAILVRSLPFPDSGRFVTIINSYPGVGYERGGTSIANYFERRDGAPAFTSVALIANDTTIVGDAGSPERVSIGRVTPEFFATLGVPLARGRSFTDAELAQNADDVAVLTDEFWRTHFNASPDVLGRTFRNDGVSITVIGVLPPGFRFLSSVAQFFRPLSHAPQVRLPSARHASAGIMVARLAAGASLTLAQSQLDLLENQLAPADPQEGRWPRWGYHTIARSLHADHVREVRPVLLLVQAGAFFLLLIGLVNVANLLLVRSSARAQEMAVRRALGATARHVAAQLVTEILLLAVSGGALGLILAVLGVRGIAQFGVDRLPLGSSVMLDGGTAAVGLAVTLAAGGFLAVPVLWFTLRARLASGLQLQSRGGTAGRPVQRLRHGFIVVQISLTFMLLTGSGLLGLSLRRLLEIPAGFNASNIVSGQITLPQKFFPDPQQRNTFIARLLPEVRAIPGVTQVAINNGMPFTGRVGGGVVAVEGSEHLADKLIHAHHHLGVTSEYWTLLSIPLLRGRLLNEADEQRPGLVCVVDRAFAERYWPGGDPIGRRLSNSDTFDENKSATIVGVVGSVKQNSLTENSDFGAVYYPFSKLSSSFFYLSVRATQPIDQLAPAIRKAILQLDPNLPIDDLRPLQTRIDDSLVARRSPAMLVGLFAGVALILAAVGTYGVLSYAVAQRHREIGIRMALGAQPREIGGQFIKHGLQLLLAGIILGVGGTILAQKAIQGALFGVTALDRTTLGATAAILAIVSLIACWLPARRAAKVDPMVALRCE